MTSNIYIFVSLQHNLKLKIIMHTGDPVQLVLSPALPASSIVTNLPNPALRCIYKKLTVYVHDELGNVCVYDGEGTMTCQLAPAPSSSITASTSTSTSSSSLPLLEGVDEQNRLIGVLTNDGAFTFQNVCVSEESTCASTPFSLLFTYTPPTPTPTHTLTLSIECEYTRKDSYTEQAASLQQELKRLKDRKLRLTQINDKLKELKKRKRELMSTPGTSISMLSPYAITYIIHSPYTIYHTPYTIHHTPYTIQHSSFLQAFQTTSRSPART
ncbi:hypothetical protein EON64_07820 [archaeon]|nr:MAG: hypothetical protein EON64_07820 [archaeon]